MQAIAAEATQALLADGHDGAQDRREVATLADQNLLPDEKKVSVAYMGLIHKAYPEARIIGDTDEAIE